MIIRCANCNASVNILEEQFGRPCECPSCHALLLLPRLKRGESGESIPTAEIRSLEEFKREILDSLKPELAKLTGSQAHAPVSEELIGLIVDRMRVAGFNGGLEMDKLVHRVCDSLKPDLAKWVAVQSTAAAAGIDAGALREQLRADILREVRSDLAAMRPGQGMDPAAADAFAKAIEALGNRLTAAQAASLPAATAPAAADQAEAETKPAKIRRKPFQSPSESVLPLASPKEQYPAVTLAEPDTTRVISLNAGNNENLKAFLQEVSSVQGRLVMFEPTQSVKDVGTWRKGRVWIVVTPEKILLAAYGRRTYRQEISLSSIPESFWNEFTSEVVFVPLEPKDDELRSVKLTQDRAYYLLGLIHHAVPA